MQSVFNNFAESKGKEKTARKGTWSASYICAVTTEYSSPLSSPFHFLLYPGSSSTDPNSTQRCIVLGHTGRETQGQSADSHSEPEVQSRGLPGLWEAAVLAPGLFKKEKGKEPHGLL